MGLRHAQDALNIDARDISGPETLPCDNLMNQSIESMGVQLEFFQRDIIVNEAVGDLKNIGIETIIKIQTNPLNSMKVESSKKKK